MYFVQRLVYSSSSLDRARMLVVPKTIYKAGIMCKLVQAVRMINIFTTTQDQQSFLKIFRSCCK